MTYYPYSNNNISYHNQNKFWRFFKILFFIILVLIVALSVFSHEIASSQNSVLSGIGRLPVIKQFRQLMGMENLKGELNDRINFLLLGQGGVGHEGPYLTDTIIFASFKPSTKDLAIISIPRDFFVEIKDHGWYKINTANSLGETEKYAGGGAAFTAKVIEDIFGQPVHYWLRVDFDAFEKIINDLGGVNVCIDRTFEDPNYPTDDFKVQTVSFIAGCQTMDGTRALQFARSRHGTNNEGSDFARAARQQKIILGIKDKALSLDVLTSPTKFYNLIKTLNNHLQTNISLTEIPYLIKMLKGVQPADIKRIVLDNSPSGLLRNGMTAEGAFILKPRTGDLTEIQNLTKYIFILKAQAMEPVKIIILNGTEIGGWARDIGGYLEQLGFKILNTNNSPKTTFEKTVIYDLQKKENKEALVILRKSLGANVSKYLPDFINAKEVSDFDQADYIVVLGCKKDGNCWIEDEVYKELEKINSSTKESL